MNKMFPVEAIIALCVMAAPGEEKKPKPSAPVPAEVGDISGYYSCEGTEAKGSKYHGIVTIVRKADIYVVTWSIGEGSNFVGVGVKLGDNLSVGWAMPVGEGKVVRGVNVYRVDGTKERPKLVGRWATIPGNGTVQSETLTFIKGMEKDEGEVQ